MPNLESSGQIKYLSSNSTSSSFPATAAGRVATAPSNLYSTGAGSGEKFRGLELTPFGAGSANQTFDYKVWVVKRGFSNFNGSTPADYDQQLWCSGTVTLGTKAGVATSGGPLSTDLLGDTITVTASAYATASVAAYGGLLPSAHSPADDTEARLFIPDLGDASDIFIEFDMTGATSGNFMAERVV